MSQTQIQKKESIVNEDLLTIPSALAKLNFSQYFDNRRFSADNDGTGIITKLLPHLLPLVNNQKNAMNYQYTWEYRSLTEWKPIKDLVAHYEYMDTIMQNHPYFELDQNFQYKLTKLPVSEYFEIQQFYVRNTIKNGQKIETKRNLYLIKIFEFAVTVEKYSNVNNDVIDHSYVYMNDEKQITRFQYVLAQRPITENISFNQEDNQSINKQTQLVINHNKFKEAKERFTNIESDDLLTSFLGIYGINPFSVDIERLFRVYIRLVIEKNQDGKLFSDFDTIEYELIPQNRTTIQKVFSQFFKENTNDKITNANKLHEIQIFTFRLTKEKGNYEKGISELFDSIGEMNDVIIIRQGVTYCPGSIIPSLENGYRKGKYTIKVCFHNAVILDTERAKRSVRKNKGSTYQLLKSVKRGKSFSGLVKGTVNEINNTFKSIANKSSDLGIQKISSSQSGFDKINNDFIKDSIQESRIINNGNKSSKLQSRNKLNGPEDSPYNNEIVRYKCQQYLNSNNVLHAIIHSVYIIYTSFLLKRENQENN